MSRLESDISCDEVVELVTDYFEDALPDEERSRFEMHIVMCRGCDAYLSQHRATIEAVGSLNGDAPGLDSLVEAFRGWRQRADEEEGV